MAATIFVGVHHIGICVRDLDAALATYGEHLGLVAPATRMETDEIRGALLAVGPELLEIFEPRDPTGPLGRFMERRGEGLHHVAYRVDDIEAALRELAGRGARLVDSEPRPGLHPGWRIAFIHPGSAAGVLTELVQVDPVEPSAAPTIH